MGILSFIFRTSLRRRAQDRRVEVYVESEQTVCVEQDARDFQPTFPESGNLTGKCYVIDGDTIRINKTKIRLAGIDAPELDEPWGQKAKWTMVQICKGQVITAELTGERSYDRLIGTCYLPDGRDIGAELIKLGLALDGGIFSNGKYRHLEPKGARQKLKWIHLQKQ